MSNLLFNIRFGMTHFQLTKDWKFERSENSHHRDNPKMFEVYCAFGIHFS